jgi:ABC-type nitrate/sulfonate/bicarbonate transport system substrate-binding protein
MRKSRISVVTGFVAICALALGVTSCSSSGSSNANNSGSSTQAAKLSITLAVPEESANFPQYAIATQLGYFKDAGVSVNVIAVGANTVATVVGGQADLGVIGLPGPMLPSAQGKSTSLIYAATGGGVSAFVAGQPGKTSISSCRRVATDGVGTSSYQYTKYFEKVFHANWKITTVTDAGSFVALLASKQVDCAVGTKGNFAAQLQSGQMSTIIDPGVPSTLPAGFDRDLPAGVLFGVTDNLKAKRKAVIAFLAAWIRATNFLKNSSAAAAAAVTIKEAGWNTTSMADMTTQLQANRPFWAINGGQIDASSWPDALQLIVDGGTTLQGGTDNSLWSYDQRVDMSYYKAATTLASSK